MTTRVMKFGGTSVATPEAIDAAVAIVRRARSEADRLVVVVSALAGVTDGLEAAIALAARRDPEHRDRWRSLRDRHRSTLAAIARPPSALVAADELDAELAALGRRLEAVALLGKAPPCVAAEILAAGERLAAPLFVAALAAVGEPAERIDATELLAVAGDPLDGEPDLAASRGLPGWRRLAAAALAVVPGFFGVAFGEVRLLGRGGSDTSATALGALLDAERVEIWTDVDGVFARDPRTSPGARPFARLDFDRAERLAREGARVLHAKAIAPARGAALEIRVRNTFRPEARGTRIRAAGPPAEPATGRPVLVWGASL
jgi:aspartate kinase